MRGTLAEFNLIQSKLFTNSSKDTPLLARRLRKVPRADKGMIGDGKGGRDGRPWSRIRDVAS